VRRTLDADLAAASEIVSQILLRADLPESAMERRHLRLMVTDLRRNSRWITLSASFPGPKCCISLAEHDDARCVDQTQ
jgi:hypothetical protein